ncbi:MAG: hypothetical protein V4546_01200 [Bacteroidota bacterium]
MKILFITNDISFYGASRSLRTLINGLQKTCSEKIEVHLVVPKRLKSKNDFASISAWFGIPESRISEFCLPFYNNYKGKLNSFYHLLFNLKWQLKSNQLYKFLEKENFDVVHLNSLTLLPVANDKFPTILHVREVIDEVDNISYIQKKLDRLHKIIFIDEATSSALNYFTLPNWEILNNPFSMQGLANIAPSAELSYLEELAKGKTVFSLIGKIHKDKGSEFIIRAFDNLSDNYILLIKGGGQAQYIDYLKNVASSNVVFLDAGPDIENLYIVSDYVLRGEDFPCIGRTTFEGLYAGLGVVLPGDDQYYVENLSGYANFSNEVHTYEPRNTAKLVNVIEALKPIPKSNRKLLGNTAAYIENFIDFVKK